MLLIDAIAQGVGAAKFKDRISTLETEPEQSSATLP
jgi:hypothetical protein